MNACVFRYHFPVPTIGWVKEVRAGNKKVKIVPRLLFEGWSANSFVTLFRNPEHVKSIGQTIVSFLTVSDTSSVEAITLLGAILLCISKQLP